MAGEKKDGRAPRVGSLAPRATPASASSGVPAGPDGLEEIQRLLDAPLSDLLGTAEERAEAKELARRAAAAPAITRLSEVVAFVGSGRPATQAGNLRAADALALARRLDPSARLPEKVRSMDDLPETAHAFRWAAASELLAWRGTRIVAGPCADDLERDPLSAWLRATLALLEHGVLDGFRQGWRKSYVELLDAGAAGLLVALAEAGGRVPVAAVDEGAWEQVAAAYGYEPDDEAERAHVVRLVRAMESQLSDADVMGVVDDEVTLTELGSALAVIVSLAGPDDADLDLVDTDAHSLLLVCAEEMEPADARASLLAWCQARPACDAVDELCEAIVDDDDPDVWDLGFEALETVDRAVAEPAVSGLRSHPGLRPRADAGLQGRRSTPPPATRG